VINLFINVHWLVYRLIKEHSLKHGPTWNA